MSATYAANFDAALAQLKLSLKLNDKTYDSEARLDEDGTLTRANYCVAYSDPTEIVQTRFSATQSQSRQEDRIVVRSVGIDPSACRKVATAVTDQLLGFRPTLSNRNTERVKSEGRGEMVPDDSVKPPLYYVDETFVFASDPA